MKNNKWLFYTGSVLLVLGFWPVWMAGFIFNMILIVFTVGMSHGESFMDWGLDLHNESPDQKIITGLNKQVKDHE